MFEYFLVWMLISATTFMSNFSIALIVMSISFLFITGFTGLLSAGGTVSNTDYSYPPTEESLTGESIIFNKCKGKIKLAICALAIGVLFDSFAPSEKELYMILGAGTALHLMQNEEAQQIPTNLMKAANDWLESYHATEKVNKQ